MIRAFVALLLAPLWVPVATAVFAAYTFPHPEQQRWIYITVIIGTIFGYGGTLTLGVPAFLLLHGHKNTAFWIAPVFGFAAGALTGWVFLVLFALSLGNSFAFVLHETANSSNWVRGILPAGALGSIVGATLWLIARPDRQRAT